MSRVVLIAMGLVLSAALVVSAVAQQPTVKQRVALVPVPLPREQRTWKLLTSEPAFDAMRERVLNLVRAEVDGG